MGQFLQDLVAAAYQIANSVANNIKNLALDSTYQVVNNGNMRVLEITNKQSNNVYKFNFNNKSNCIFDSYKIEPSNSKGNLELEGIINKNHIAKFELEPIINNQTNKKDYSLKSVDYSGPNITFKFP